MHPACQQGTKSSTKQLAPTDPILRPENLLKTRFAQKGLPSGLSGRHKPQSHTKTCASSTLMQKNFTKINLNTVPKNGTGGPIFGTACTALQKNKEKHFHGAVPVKRQSNSAENESSIAQHFHGAVPVKMQSNSAENESSIAHTVQTLREEERAKAREQTKPKRGARERL